MLLVLSLVQAPLGLAQNLIINGGFELNSASGTLLNLTNGQLESLVDDITAFGLGEETDLINSADHGAFVAPHSGNWSLGLNAKEFPTVGEYDAFSFSLSAPIEQGQWYELSFYAESDRSGFDATLSVGVSTLDDAFGDLLINATVDSRDWEFFTYTFQATTEFSYITVRSDLGYAGIDTFSLIQIPEPAHYGVVLSGFFSFIALFKRRRVAF